MPVKGLLCHKQHVIICLCVAFGSTSLRPSSKCASWLSFDMSPPPSSSSSSSSMRCLTISSLIGSASPPPGIVCHKSIHAKMFTHDLLCLSMPVRTTVAGTQSGTRSFGLCKCSIKESIGLLNPFIAPVTPMGPARVHPLTRSSIL